jgi:hypothetical protein
MLMNEFLGLEIYGEFIEEGYAVAGVILMGKDGGDIREIDIDFDQESDQPKINFFDQDGTEFKFKNL